MTSSLSKGRSLAATPIHLAVMALVASLGAAHAQSTDAVPAAQQQAADSGAIPEVVVTATKRATPLQRTPVAITALNAATLQDAHVQTILDAVNLVPGFQATGQGDHGVITMTLRGIGNDSAKTEYADPEVAMFVDGIYTPRPEGATSLLFDLDTIEVLRGPQGTLWGRNSTVGAVNMQTAKPVLGKTSGSAEAGLGDYRRMGARGAFNVPLSDTAAMRVAFVHEQHDGYTDYQTLPVTSLATQRAAWEASGGAPERFQPINRNLFVNAGPKYNAQDQSAVRLSFLFQPSTALKWNIAYERFADRGTPSMNLLQTPRSGTDLWSTLSDVAPTLRRDVDSVRSRLEYMVGPATQLTYVAGWTRFDGESTFDQDGGATIPTSFSTGATYQADNTVNAHYVNSSHEVQLQSIGEQELDWQLGLYYAAEKNAMRFDIPILSGTQQGSVNWQGSFIQPEETVDSRAAYGQATWNVGGTLHLTAGGRYTRDERKNVGGNGYTWTGGNDPTVPQVPLSANIDPRIPGQGYSPSVPSNDGRYTGNKWTGLLRAAYDIDRNNMVYASVSTGYKSGGLQDGGRPYGDETLTNFEIGSKSTFLGGAVRVNNALYYEDFKDYQFSAPITNPDGSHTLATNNADGAKVYGLESEIAARLTPNDRLQVSLAWTHTKLGHLVGGSNDYTLPACSIPGVTTCLDVTGNKMPHAPSFTAQVMYQHVFNLDGGAQLTPRIAAHYETASWLSVFNLGPGDQQEAYTRTDLGLRYQSSRSWWVDLFARNVSNTRVKTSALNAFGPWMAQYLPPRTVGINAGIDF